MALDVGLACFFVLLDTTITLAGASWWPAHPGKLAWAMLVLQALADASLVARRRAPMLVIAILTGFTLAISLLISPAGALTPAHAGNVWAPYGTILAAYGPFYYRKDRRAAFAAVGMMTLVAARVWEPSASVITIAVLRTAVGPLLARDRPGSPAVAVVNENFAQVNFPGQNPVGKHILLWGEHQETTLKRDMEIVGVARNAHYGNLKNEFLPVVYLPFNQGFPPPNEMTFAIRTAGDPLAFVNSIRDAVRNADSHLPISKVRTQKAEIRQNMYEEAILADLSSAFAVLALVISCVGLYGTISYGVARRTGEIGIRMALGAQRGPVLWMVLREVCLLAALGLAISIPIALGTSKFLQSLLFKMKPNDPLALVAAVAILLVAALLAGSVPARRAANIDPMSALRHE